MAVVSAHLGGSPVSVQEGISMVAPGDKAQAKHDAVSARADFCGPPRDGPALRALPLPGTSKHTIFAPTLRKTTAATTPLSAAPSQAVHQSGAQTEAAPCRDDPRGSEGCPRHLKATPTDSKRYGTDKSKTFKRVWKS